jgi:hypothetical protein
VQVILIHRIQLTICKVEEPTQIMVHHILEPTVLLLHIQMAITKSPRRPILENTRLMLTADIPDMQPTTIREATSTVTMERSIQFVPMRTKKQTSSTMLVIGNVLLVLRVLRLEDMVLTTIATVRYVTFISKFCDLRKKRWPNLRKVISERSSQKGNFQGPAHHHFLTILLFELTYGPLRRS